MRVPYPIWQGEGVQVRMRVPYPIWQGEGVQVRMRVPYPIWQGEGVQVWGIISTGRQGDSANPRLTLSPLQAALPGSLSKLFLTMRVRNGRN